ncbi:MAG: hypothetical protein ABI612_07040 [Betaproteobacteria bacterium]
MDITTQDLINWLADQGATFTIVGYGPKTFSGFQEQSAFKGVNPRLGGEGVTIPLGPPDSGDQIVPERQAREWCRALGYKAPPKLDLTEPAGGNNRLQELEGFLAALSDVRTKVLEGGKSLMVERNGKSVMLNRQTLNYLDVINCCNELNMPYPQSIVATERESVDTETLVDAITAANGNRVFRSVSAADGSYTLKSTDRLGGARIATVRSNPAGPPMRASEAVRLCRDLDVDPPAVIPNNLRRNDFAAPGPSMPKALGTLVNRQQQAIETADRAAAAAAGKPYDPDADQRPLLTRVVNDNNAERGVNARGERVRETAEEIRKERGERPPAEREPPDGTGDAREESHGQ